MKELIIDHIQNTLGPISALASGKDEQGNPFPFQIGFIPNCPSEGATTLVTVGMSEKSLKQEDGISARHELLFCTYQNFGQEIFSELMQVLGYIAEDILQSGDAIGRGDMIRLEGPIVPGSKLTGVFLFDPVYFSEESWSIENIDPSITFAWVVPITEEEMLFTEAEGPEALSDLFLQQDPDLMNLMRDGITLRKH